VEQIPQIALNCLSDYEKLYAPFESTYFGLPFGLGGAWHDDVWYGKMYLSASSWALRRVIGSLPFELDDAAMAGVLPGSSLQNELKGGRLYFINYTIIEQISPVPGKYVGGSMHVSSHPLPPHLSYML